MIGGLIDISALRGSERQRIGNQIGSFISRAAPSNQEYAIGSLHAAIVAGREPLGVGGLGHTVSINTFPILRVEQSDIHGLGVFAKCEFNEGDYIIAIRSQIMHQYEVQDDHEMLFTWRVPADSMWIHGQFDHDMANITRYLNSSGDGESNVFIEAIDDRKLLVVRAQRDIDDDEELTCDYDF